MSKRITLTTILLLLVLVACIKEDPQEFPPAPTLTPAPTQTSPSEYVVNLETPFTLAVGQRAVVQETELAITFESIERDGRCPSAVTCSEDGPVIIIVSLKLGENQPTTLTMNPDPEMARLSGIPPNTFNYEGYGIELTAVEPYPVQPEDNENLPYTATFIVHSE